jgi:hypothetical protein
LSRDTPVTAIFFCKTVTLQVAVFPPSFVRTVIVAEPTAFAVTTPEEETVAMDVLLDDQVTDLSVALDGLTVAERVCVSPSVIVILFLSRETLVTKTVAALTVTVHFAVFPPSFVLTVIVAVPATLAVTTPEPDTVATDVLLEDQETFLLVALEGVTVAVSVCVSPTVMDRDVLFRETPVTGTVAAWTFTVQVAVFPPSFVVTVIVAVPTD